MNCLNKLIKEWNNKLIWHNDGIKIRLTDLRRTSVFFISRMIDCIANVEVLVNPLMYL